MSSVVGIVQKDKERRALIIQPGAVGDVILTLPLVQFLRAEAGFTSVDIMGRLDHLSYLQSCGPIDQAICLETARLHPLFTDPQAFSLLDVEPLAKRFRPYELIVTFLSDPKDHFERNLILTVNSTHAVDVVTIELHPSADYPHHVAAYYIEQFVDEIPDMMPARPPAPPAQPDICVQSLAAQMGRSLLEQAGVNRSAKIIALHPGSGGEHKCWPLNHFNVLLDGLMEKGWQSVVLLGSAELERFNDAEIDDLQEKAVVLSDLDLEQVAAVLSCCHGYVGNDSGISHLAGALLDSVVIFGPTSPSAWRPLGTRVRVIASESQSQPYWPKPAEVFGALCRLVQEDP